VNIIEAVIVGIVEGLTEFLPISSTAHMRITENLLGIANDDDFVQTFTIVIQLGAILSVVCLYWRKFLQFRHPQFYLKLFVAVIPALILGKLFNDWIDTILEKPIVMSVILLLGGVLFLFIDQLFQRQTIDQEEKISIPLAFKIGIFQCMAIFLPGLSRSAATIIGGMSQRLTRSAAAEFSFFLAVPTLGAATCYEMLKALKAGGAEFDSAWWNLLIVGIFVSFISAIVVIKVFLALLRKYPLSIFGYYRIALAAILYFLLSY
jgi:undecaprenyl-diphosphatase